MGYKPSINWINWCRISSIHCSIILSAHSALFVDCTSEILRTEVVALKRCGDRSMQKSHCSNSLSSSVKECMSPRFMFVVLLSRRWTLRHPLCVWLYHGLILHVYAISQHPFESLWRFQDMSYPSYISIYNSYIKQTIL